MCVCRKGTLMLQGRETHLERQNATDTMWNLRKKIDFFVFQYSLFPMGRVIYTSESYLIKKDNQLQYNSIFCSYTCTRKKKHKVS